MFSTQISLLSKEVEFFGRINKISSFFYEFDVQIFELILSKETLSSICVIYVEIIDRYINWKI